MRMVLNQWKALGHPKPEYENDCSRKAFEIRLPLGQSQVTDEVTPPVAPPVTPPVKSLVELLEKHGALSAADIRNKLGLKDRTHVREAYLNPSLKAKLVEYTVPDKPQSRLQKYRLTQAGQKIVKQLG